MLESSDPLHHETSESECKEPPLHRAARVGDTSAIELLIANGADPSERFEDRTPLMTAAASSDGASVETIHLFLNLGADPKLLINNRSAATHASFDWADSVGGDPERLAALVEAGSPLILEGEAQRRLVANVARLGNSKLLNLLLEAGASANPVWDPLTAAERARRSREDMEAFAREHADPSDDPGLSERTLARENEDEKRDASAPWSFEIPLFMAVEADSVECVRVLLSHGADPSILDNSGETALSAARSSTVLALLREAGLALDDRNYLGWSPLRDAVSDGEYGIDRVRALIAAGADVNETHDRGYTIFMSAVGSMERDVRVMRMLVEAGADPHAVTELGWNAFHAAIDVNGEANAEQSVRDTLGYLKELGVNIEQKNHLGETPLAKAVFLGYGIEVRVLSELGADPNAVGSSHWCCGGKCGLPRPLLFYVADGQIHGDEKAEALLAAGADPLALDENGYRPIDHAVARLCAHAADYDQAYEQFYKRIPRPRLPRALQNDRSAFIAAIGPVLSEYIESFARSIETAIDAGGDPPSEKNRELYNTVKVLAAYEMWARLQMTQ